MKAQVLFFISLWLLSALACGTVAFPAPQPTAIPTSEPTQTPSLSQSVQLISIAFHEDNESPVFTINAQIPNLTGSDDPGVAAFNSLMHSAVMGEVNHFKDQTIIFASDPPITSGSSFDVKYSVIGQAGNFWSIKFDVTGYSDGAAHPYHYSMTINFDLERRTDITLDEVFHYDSNYLQKISDICKAELATRDIAFDMFAQGADPTPENYQRWNVSKEGLVITFDECQVAPLAAGPQIVVIPFGELEGLINGRGPIVPFLQLSGNFRGRYPPHRPAFPHLRWIESARCGAFGAGKNGGTYSGKAWRTFPTFGKDF